MLEVLGYQALPRNGRRIAWLPPVETIPSGEYTFGSQDDPEAHSDEHRFNQRLAAFALGRFPVTNAEWGCFIKVGGYEEPRWWRGEASRRYREEGSMEGQINTWEWWRDQARAGKLEQKLATSSMEPDTQDLIRSKTGLDDAGWQAYIDSLRASSQAVKQPAFWKTARYGGALQPVVGISLFEVLAYCQWLSEVTGEAYGLPNELQWEAAARGPGPTPRRYAFEGELPTDVCNIAEPRCFTGAPTPVGLYAKGRTPDTALYDMTGSVWEWTTSAWREELPYDLEPLSGLEEASVRRVVRGGAWNNNPRNARAAYRNHTSCDQEYPIQAMHLFADSRVVKT